MKGELLQYSSKTEEDNIEKSKLKDLTKELKGQLEAEKLVCCIYSICSLCVVWCGVWPSGQGIGLLIERLLYVKFLFKTLTCIGVVVSLSKKLSIIDLLCSSKHT